MACQSAPELLHLLSKLRQFREQKTTLDELQTTLWGTAQALTSREDKRLREQLQDAEGRMELIRYTVEKEQIGEEVRKVLEAVESAINANINGIALMP